MLSKAKVFLLACELENWGACWYCHYYFLKSPDPRTALATINTCGTVNLDDNRGDRDLHAAFPGVSGPNSQTLMVVTMSNNDFKQLL